MKTLTTNPMTSKLIQEEETKLPNKEECNQCKLEGNSGICDRKDCSNSSTSDKTWEELYDGTSLKNTLENIKGRDLDTRFEVIHKFVESCTTSATIKAKRDTLQEIEDVIELEKKMISENGEGLTENLREVVKGLNLAWLEVHFRRVNLEEPSK